ncbi:ribonuclease HII [Alishewanella longhuensis]
MALLHQRYPQFGFADHKGYPTAAHLAAIQQYGILAEHRRSFKPVRLIAERDALSLVMTEQASS